MMQQSMRPKPTEPISVYVTLGAEVYEQISRLVGQSESKLPVFSLQARLTLIYRPTEGMKIIAKPPHSEN
ncbi:hypothetical protein TNCV_255621 [Trichonephila clavipes]|nr:hypothetical protein TNCV_255621 [Trichonephila clavipes]